MGISDYSSSSSSSSNDMSNLLGESPRGVVLLLSTLFQKTTYDGWEETIKSKLREEMRKNENLEKQIREKYGLSIDEFAKALGNEELFKKAFLLPNYKPDKILKEIENELI